MLAMTREYGLTTLCAVGVGALLLFAILLLSPLAVALTGALG